MMVLAELVAATTRSLEFYGALAAARRRRAPLHKRGSRWCKRAASPESSARRGCIWVEGRGVPFSFGYLR
jgi:hypothetical protein